MKIEDTIRYIAAIDDAIAAGSIEFALVTLESLGHAAGAKFVTPGVGQLRESYKLMTQYALDGVVDPHREALLNDIRAEIVMLSRRCLRQTRMADDPALYYSTARVAAMRRDTDIPTLCRRVADLSLATLGLEMAGKENEFEDAIEDLFNRVWTASPLSHGQVTALNTLLTDETVPSRVKRHITSAIALGQLEFHDDSRLILMADAYTAAGDTDPMTAMTALSGMLAGLWVNRDRTLKTRTSARLAALVESRHWNTDVRLINLEFARARDTERINRKIRDELMPGLMKLRPDIEKRLGSTAFSDPASLEENPEWQELVEKSGLGNKLRELSEIQEDGGDVMMLAMGNLKGFPFFHKVSNWFIPFYSGHTAVKSSPEMATLVEALPGMTDSDRYSIVLAMAMMPADRREAVSSQLRAQGDAMMEMAKATAPENASAERREAAAMAVRGAYRFFKQYRRKGEFHDPFGSPISLAALPLTAPVLGDAETLGLMAEFYFKRGYHADALLLFRTLSHIIPTTAQLFQKIGYCLQQTGDIAGALEAYDNSELLKSDSPWTLRHIAACHRALGNSSEAVRYYARLAEMQPDDARLALTLGHCLLEDHRPAEALKQYFKAEYLKPDSSKTRRPIAWASLLTGDFDRSARYYETILADDPKAEDYINAGHLEMARQRYREAVAQYAKALTLMEFDTRRFLKALADDACVLDQLGVDSFMRGIVSDAVMADSRDTATPLNKPN